MPASVAAEPPSAAKLAEPPRLTVDTTYVRPHGKTLVVRRGGDFQAALDAASPGDVITLEAGATFSGPFTLPVKTGSGWIVVRSSAPPSKLPPPGCRVDPSYARLMPKLVGAPGPVLTAAPGAHHYRFIGIEIRPGGTGGRSMRQILRSARRWITEANAAPAADVSDQTLVQLGAGETSIDKLPHHIIFDRCYLHGDPKHGTRRGIAMNSRYTAVVDSYLSDFKTVGEDSQAIAGWNGPGPFKIVNNYLEAAGENVMFGGGTPSIRNLVPSDIVIRHNFFYKPLSWKIGAPTYEGTPWTVKNLFELKNARRVLIEGNVFEHNWVQGQNGFAILFTVRTEGDAVPWAVVEDVLFVNNVVRQSGSGINILGIDDGSADGNGRTRRVTIRNNLFDDIGGAPWGAGLLFQLQNGTRDVVIEHNTCLQTSQIVSGGDARANTGFVFADNIAPHNDYGIVGSGTGPGRPSLARYFPGAVVRRNVIAGGSEHLYPPDNFFPGSLKQVRFADGVAGDYRLKPSSPYRRAATDGGDVGVDFEALRAALGPDLADGALNAKQEERRWTARLK